MFLRTGSAIMLHVLGHRGHQGRLKMYTHSFFQSPQRFARKPTTVLGQFVCTVRRIFYFNLIFCPYNMKVEQKFFLFQKIQLFSSAIKTQNQIATYHRELHERLSRSVTVPVWSTICAESFFSTYFFEDENGVPITITFDRYIDMLRPFIEPNSKEVEEFQDEQGSAMA